VREWDFDDGSESMMRIALSSCSRLHCWPEPQKSKHRVRSSSSRSWSSPPASARRDRPRRVMAEALAARSRRFRGHIRPRAWSKRQTDHRFQPRLQRRTDHPARRTPYGRNLRRPRSGVVGE
jgi:hypothetical protein